MSNWERRNDVWIHAPSGFHIQKLISFLHPKNKSYEVRVRFQKLADAKSFVERTGSMKWKNGSQG